MIGMQRDHSTALICNSAMPPHHPCPFVVTGRLKIELTEAWEDFKEAGAFNRIPMAIELPFTLLRKATVPLTAEDAYSKPWLVISTAMTPFWISYYLERDGIMMVRP